VLQHISQRTSH